MFRKLLIANRGEIARRINRVAHSMGMKTVAVYSDADARLPFVREASESMRIGPAPAKDSYLNAAAIIEAARTTSSDAIHPGYGFLSENAAFAGACSEAGITFVGPSPEAMERMKDKSEARKLVQAVGVPVVPGSEGILADVESCQVEAARIGFPVLIKAASGGGGIGMAPAKDTAELDRAFRQCTDRAAAAFGKAGVYLEKYFPRPRHIEVQILADHDGHVIHVLERECSIQRRHQKVVEEAPSPLFETAPDWLRRALFDAAIKAARAFKYVNAGTVEFLYSDGGIYFIEMNARLQVEHPITELTTGIDLIGWQLKIAAGEKLTVRQEDVRRLGTAMEFRIYAEDPVKFLPSPGTISAWVAPEGQGVRLDAGYEEGSVVTPNYDPMLAKLIISGIDRAEVIAKAKVALESFKVEGIKTNIPLHRRIVADPAFQEGRLDTRFLQEHAQP